MKRAVGAYMREDRRTERRKDRQTGIQLEKGRQANGQGQGGTDGHRDTENGD